MEDDANSQYPRREPQLKCPWVSAAPMGCTSTTKTRQMVNNVHKFIQQQEPSHVYHQLAMKQKFKPAKATQQQQRPVDTANHFYYFLKLMQTFPDVHPATLHSVMCLCNHNFSAAVETLITAKNYKETYMHRKMMNNVRYHPYQAPQTKHLQAQTSNGQLYDIVSIVSDSNMPNIQYSIRDDASEMILVDAKKINEQECIPDQVDESEEKVVLAQVAEATISVTAADVNAEESIECNDYVDNSSPSKQEQINSPADLL